MKLVKLACFATLLTLNAGLLTAIPAGAASQSVTAKLSAVTVDAGKSVHLSGKVTPPVPGAVIRVQRFVSNRWRTVQSKHLTKQSTYDFVVKMGGPGVFKFRAAAPKGNSPARALSVYAFQLLSRIEPVHGYGYDCSNVRTIAGNGKLYTHPCAIYAAWNTVDYYSAEWNLKKACTTFSAVIGLDEGDNSLAQVQLKVTDEYDTTIYDHTFGIGDAVPVSLNLRGLIRVKFTTLGVNPDDTDAGLIVLGDPQIRCTWKQPTS